MNLGPSMENIFGKATAFKTQLGKSLGSGRFGQVFQGRNAAYGGSGSVAVKVIRSAAGEVDCKEPFLLRRL